MFRCVFKHPRPCYAHEPQNLQVNSTHHSPATGGGDSHIASCSYRKSERRTTKVTHTCTHQRVCGTKFSKMMFVRGAKQSIEILCRRVSTPIHSKYGYSTWSYGENFISESKRNETQCTIVRKYSSQVSPSDHMNLIKKLREITSAPIKEVKSALIDCNWDLEAA
ncbi:hypothetical protein L1987_02235 [Smallanthus sonchifolius]|uniref:Uncharacterized protein n=1 Tax=Smallanthus sonchifolius TaxID=185202 RepID=A0ACB9K791_9ASTR|nr:hypothetical protein L1987_02235 [Smallanthus sonchifolius]